MSEIVIIDTGVANVASIANAFDRLGASITLTRAPDVVRRATRLVLPGVGAFGAGATALQTSDVGPALRDSVARGTPLLAVCLGLQLLSEGSEEAPGVAGLGIVPGRCQRLRTGARIPHLGWNRVAADPGTRLVESGEAAFANSFAFLAAPPGWLAAWTIHGTPFVAALERGEILACQFHPELSGQYGQELLARWLERTPRARRPESPARPAGLLRRIVPCLDVRDGRVVKGVNFQKLRDIGDPAERAAEYEAQGADEIVMLDIAAAPAGRDTQVDAVRRVRAAIRIPFTVGGGVRSVADARRLLSAGADKVTVNTAAIRRPGLLTELAEAFGRQCVVLAIDARRRGVRWEALAVGGRVSGPDAVAWATAGPGRGAGEILLTSWDADGTRQGHDLDLLRAVVDAVPVPVVASGGIGTRAHVVEAFAAGADAVLAASVLHDDAETVAGIKAYAADHGIAVRQ